MSSLFGRRDVIVVPGASTLFRALAAVDYLALERVVDWQNDGLGPDHPAELVVLDGKRLANAQSHNLVCAMAVRSRCR